jgi:hypothetical protein
MGSSTLTWICSNITLLPSTVTHLGWARCQIVGGYGRAFSFAIHYCTPTSICGDTRRVLPYDIFSYPPPQLLSGTSLMSLIVDSLIRTSMVMVMPFNLFVGTLRLTSSTSGSTTLTLDTSTTVSISFGVSYVQPSDSSTLKVEPHATPPLRQFDPRNFLATIHCIPRTSAPLPSNLVNNE